MNRQEMITKMQDKLNDFYRYKDKRNFDEVAGELYSDMEKLKQPITLAEFLGWEEDVVYKYDNDKFIIMDNQLYMRNYALRDWIDYDVSINRFDILRQAKKVEPKKYYLKHKYLGLLDNERCNYLNWNVVCKKYILDDYENTDDYVTEFTDEMIEMLVDKYGLNLMDWIKEEV